MDYVIDEPPPAGHAFGRITGQLMRADRRRSETAPFSDFTKDTYPQKYGALRLADGRWWLCNVDEDGGATNFADGIRAAGPQPKP